MEEARSIRRVVNEIVEVGALTRALADRYEGVFGLFQAELRRVADAAPSLTDAAASVIAVLDAASVALTENFPNQTPVACGAGCAWCCRLPVAVPPGIADMIREHIMTTFTVETRQALTERLRAAIHDIEAGGDRAFRRCALLDADDRCSIYAVRPISCRAFTSPAAELCRELVAGHGEAYGGVDQNPSLFRLHRDATMVLQQTAVARGLSGRQVLLPAALFEALSAATPAHGMPDPI